MTPTLTLVSHTLCPYVQRAAIVLQEKAIPFERRDIDLANKPDWFVQASPLGKTPLLMVDQDVIFESAVICEYLDEMVEPRLHPSEALPRAQHRAWMVFGSAVLDGIGALYNAPDDINLARRAAELRARFEQLEAALAGSEGPYFAGQAFSLVDAVFGPVFRYFEVIDPIMGTAWWQGLPKLNAWRGQLALRPSVVSAVSPHYPALLRDFLRARGSALSARMAEQTGSAP